MKHRKVYLTILIFAIAILCTPALIFANPKDKIERTYDFTRDGRVTLQNVSGDIVVKAWKEDKVKITATHAGGPEKDLNEVVYISQTSKDIRITTRADRSWNIFRSSHTSVHYELSIPDSAHFKAETVSGKVDISGIGGAVEVKTVSGAVNIASAKDEVKCKTISGDIDLKDIHGIADLNTTSGDIRVNRLDGSLEAETVSGDMALNHIVGKVDLKTTSGHLKATDLKGSVEAESVGGDMDIMTSSEIKEIDMETLSGDISIQGIFALNGSYTMDAHSGTIIIKVPEQSDFELTANTSSGDIDCDFKLHGNVDIDNKQLKGIVGKGGASVSISTFSGDIRIVKY